MLIVFSVKFGKIRLIDNILIIRITIMLVNILKSEVDCATITAAHLDYVGSITIDSEVMKAADILPGEKVQIVKISTGECFQMYTLVGEANSGIVSLNGSVAELVKPGEKVKITSYCWLDKQEARSFSPAILIMKDDNSWTLEPCY